MNDFIVLKLGSPYAYFPLEDEEIKRDKEIPNLSLELVDEKEFRSKGKFRSVVYLDIKFEFIDENDGPRFNVDSCASGWLIDKDIVFTAGHCVWEREKNGVWKPLHILAYIGYIGKWSEFGRAPTGTGFSESRYASLIVAPTKWCRDNDQAYDVAFIRLREPFVDAEPMEYKETPEDSKFGTDDKILVVGYPAFGTTRKPSLEGKLCLSRARHASLPPKVSEKLLRWPWQDVLQLTGSACAGMSGSPVIWCPKNRGDDNADINSSPGGKLFVIGTHFGGIAECEALASTVIGKRRNVEISYSHYTNLLDYVAQSPDERSSETGTVYRRQNDGSYRVVGQE